MSDYTVEAVGTKVSQWGEGPIFWEGKLLYVDIEGKKVNRFDPETGAEDSWDTGERTGTVVPRANGGGLVIAGDNGFSFFDPHTATKTHIADPEPDHGETYRFNDGKCDPQGRLWAGSISLKKVAGSASLYCLEPATLKVEKKFGDITNSNGIAWSLDGATMYHIDTARRAVRAYAFDDGEIEEPEVVVDFAKLGIEGSPDGMAIDSEGMLWVAVCHAGAVFRVNPKDGSLLQTVNFPCIETTACAFGGPDLADLYVTTGIKPDLEEEMAGRLFVVKGLGVKGVPSTGFSA